MFDKEGKMKKAIDFFSKKWYNIYDFVVELEDTKVLEAALKYRAFSKLLPYGVRVQVPSKSNKEKGGMISIQSNVKRDNGIVPKS